MSMHKYTIQMNYDASIVVEVYGENEGEALDRARDIAEDADIRQFTIGSENVSKIIRTD